MSAEMTFPSETFPGFTNVTLQAPDGWQPLSTPDSPMVLTRPLKPGAFTPNIVLAITRYPNEVTIEELGAAIVEQFEALAEFAEAGREYRTWDGHPAFRIEGSFRDPRAGTLYQSVWIARIEKGPFIEAVQLTASCGGDQVKDVLIDIRDMSSGARFA